MTLERRRFLTYFAGTGVASTLFPGALWAIAQQQQQNRITKEMIQQAEQLAGLEFTDEERTAMVDGVNGNLRNIEALRAVDLPNSVPPAIQFDPVVPGFRAPTVKRPVRYSAPGAVVAPKNLEEVAFWPVLKLAELVRSRQVSPVALTEMYVDRLKRHGARLEAVVTMTEERALSQARRAEQEIRAGRYRGRLHGIPWGAKDLLATKGIRTTWGSKPYENQMIDVDATVVQRLDAAGAILIGKLTLGALAQGDRWYGGMTRNPWRLEQGSSGSSAGPGAATAAGLVGFSIGTETQGSIVSPSTRNGVTGLRPTFGRVPRTGAMALVWSMDKIGPMCRTVEDCALVFAAIQGPDGQDLTIKNLPFNWDATRPLSSIRVGYFKSAFDQTENHPTKPFDDAALPVLEKLGIKPVPVDLSMSLPVRTLSLILNAESAAAFDALTRGKDDDLMLPAPESSTWPRSFRQARMIPAVEYIQATRVRTLIMRALHEVMKDVDVVITPSSGGNIIPLTNHTGHPCVVLPNGFTSENTPVSISFIGGLYKEAEALRIAKAYQDATGFHLKYPPEFVVRAVGS
jgi:Asp-tRNA(Asn)/Glu-tRNA(Gln) amidotransferase A subunit family amidase/Asp-tRNA(Asn)/Glu-tRNA(Gln) amidotransferase C subunit